MPGSTLCSLRAGMVSSGSVGIALVVLMLRMTICVVVMVMGIVFGVVVVAHYGLVLSVEFCGYLTGLIRG